MLTESNATRPSLILRIGAGDPEAWREFVVIYTPGIKRWARRWNVRVDDVDDFVQDVLFKIANGASQFVYDRGKGRYRAFLKTVAHNTAKDWLGLQSRKPITNGHADGTDPMSMVADNAAVESLLEELIEGDRIVLFRQAEQQTRIESSELEWESYRQWFYLGRESLEIAAGLGINVGYYYKCKSELINRLKKNFKELDQ